MKIVHGDLIRYALDGHFDVIVHGCNQRQTWGAGIAKQLRAAFPEAYRADLNAREPDRQLGMISLARVLIQPQQASQRDFELIVVNAYTQRAPGKIASNSNAGVNVVWNIRAAFRRVKTLFAGKRIAYPKIGAGLAGESWELIAPVIDAELAGENHTLVEWGLHPERLTFRRELMGHFQDVGEPEDW